MKSSKSFNPWPASIAGLGLLFLALTAWSVFQAQSGASTVIDPSYYSHGLKFQQTNLERRAAESLGWQLETTVLGRIVKMQLTNGSQQPVSGAAGELSLFGASPGGNRSWQLQETTEGHYQTRLPDTLQGAIPASLRFQRDGVLFDRRLQLNLAKNGE